MKLFSSLPTESHYINVIFLFCTIIWLLIHSPIYDFTILYYKICRKIGLIVSSISITSCPELHNLWLMGIPDFSHRIELWFKSPLRLKSANKKKPNLHQQHRRALISISNLQFAPGLWVSILAPKIKIKNNEKSLVLLVSL